MLSAMPRLIRRTLIITIQERWTFGWSTGQPDDLREEALLAEAFPCQISLSALVKLLGLPAEAVRVVDGSIQIVLSKPPKEAIDE